jgi:hypothetical protein
LSALANLLRMHATELRKDGASSRQAGDDERGVGDVASGSENADDQEIMAVLREARDAYAALAVLVDEHEPGSRRGPAMQSTLADLCMELGEPREARSALARPAWQCTVRPYAGRAPLLTALESGVRVNGHRERTSGLTAHDIVRARRQSSTPGR